MRHANEDLVDLEGDEPSRDPIAADAVDDATAGDDLPAEPADDAPDAPPGEEEPEPPLWTTADGHVVHLPPRLIDRIVVVRRPRGPGWPRPRRPRPDPVGDRQRRQRAIRSVGRLARAATLAGRRAGMGHTPVRVFHSRSAGRGFRIVTRRRGSSGLRHEILAIQPDRAAMSGVLTELETVRVALEPITTQLPFAPLPPPGSYWPLPPARPDARVVAYLSEHRKAIGGSGRRFMANRKGTRNGVPNTPRYHVGIDILARRGSPIVACEDGTVVHFGPFYRAKSGQQTYQLLIEHSQCVVNYGEVTHASRTRLGLSVGSGVRAGQQIGYVSDTDMLHFETYRPGTRTAKRWWKGDRPPAELLDPTRYLLHLARHGLSSDAPAAPAAANGGRPPSPPAPSSAGSILTALPQAVGTAVRKAQESLSVRLAVARGERDPAKLTNMLFYTRHPERQGRRLQKGEPNFDRLAAEWLDIRDRLVRPILDGAPPSTTTGPAPAPGSADPSADVGASEGVPMGPFGTVVFSAPGRPTVRYRFTPEDVCWTARLVRGEAGGEDNLKNVAVVWALVNRFAIFRRTLPDKTFADFIRRYSTVLQPYLKNPNAIARAMDTSRRNPNNPALRWVTIPPDTFVSKGKTHPKGQYQKHLTLQQTPWRGLKPGAQRVAERVLGGRTPSPIGLASDFDGPHILLAGRLRKEGKNLSAIRKNAPEEYRRLWLAFITEHARRKGRIWIGEGAPELQQMTSNAFYLHPDTTSLPAGAVRIEAP